MRAGDRRRWSRLLWMPALLAAIVVVLALVSNRGGKGPADPSNGAGRGAARRSPRPPGKPGKPPVPARLAQVLARADPGRRAELEGLLRRQRKRDYAGIRERLLELVGEDLHAHLLPFVLDPGCDEEIAFAAQGLLVGSDRYSSLEEYMKLLLSGEPIDIGLPIKDPLLFDAFTLILRDPEFSATRRASATLNLQYFVPDAQTFEHALWAVDAAEKPELIDAAAYLASKHCGRTKDEGERRRTIDAIMDVMPSLSPADRNLLMPTLMELRADTSAIDYSASYWDQKDAAAKERLLMGMTTQMTPGNAPELGAKAWQIFVKETDPGLQRKALDVAVGAQVQAPDARTMDWMMQYLPAAKSQDEMLAILGAVETAAVTNPDWVSYALGKLRQSAENPNLPEPIRNHAASRARVLSALPH